jgi:hypothetical protein
VHDLDRITEMLATKALDTRLFERCAVSFLSRVYDGLTSVPGGSDWGRDADIHTSDGETPVRVLITSSQSLKGVQANMVGSLRSMDEHDVPVERVVLVNRLDLGQLQRAKLEDKAAEWNVVIEAHYGREFFADKLRTDGDWRQKLLGMSSHPITLSRLPPELAESAWAHLSLVGRDQEFLQLGNAVNGNDVIVFGRPGVGKSRLVSALDGVLFADLDADLDTLSNDIRWLQPQYVAVDDAGQHQDLLRRLVTLRRREVDSLTYKIVAVCWPDEVDTVHDQVQLAERLELDELERAAVDEVVQAMGVHGIIARKQILDQAEGRPGWAVALTDMLLKTREWKSIFDGSVILGQAFRYLRRRGVTDEAIDVLTALAALRFITDGEIPRLAKTLDLPTSKVRQILLGAAHSGLVDAARGPSAIGGSRRYAVRPPMLADILVAEHGFQSDVPVVNLGTLSAEWPEKSAQLAASAIKAAQLGVDGAEPTAHRLLRAVLESGTTTVNERRTLVGEFADIGPHTGQTVFELIDEEFAALSAVADFTGRRAEPLVALAAHLVRRYSLRPAVRLLLDAMLIDERPTNSNPGHPLRQLEGLVQKFHPELEPNKQIRGLIASETDKWIATRTTSTDAWVAYSAACATLLTFKQDGSHMNPVSGRELVLIDTVLPAAGMQSVYDEIWPTIYDRLRSGPPQAVRAVVEVLSTWLRIGRGLDQPFGQNHSADSIEKAAQLGRTLLEDLVPLAANHPGLQAALLKVARWCDIEVVLPPDRVRDVFLTDNEPGANRREAATQREKELEDLVAPWRDEPSQVVLARLNWIKEQSSLAGCRWPNRVTLAVRALARHIDTGDLQTWIEGALDVQLFPEAIPLVEQAVTSRSLTTDVLERCLTAPIARWSSLTAVLTSEEASSELVSFAIASLEVSDYGVLQTILFDATPEARRLAVLSTSDTALRGVAALAMFETNTPSTEWLHGNVESCWLDAIEMVDFDALQPIPEHVLQELAELLVRKRPDRRSHRPRPVSRKAPRTRRVSP